jgi:hypothetical protein
MAAGDVVAGLATLAASTSVNYQPSAGVEVFLTFAWAQQNSSGVDVAIYNGTNRVILCNTVSYRSGIGIGYSDSGVMSNRVLPMSNKYPINNTTYLRFTNNHGSSSITYHYCGIQTK